MRQLRMWQPPADLPHYDCSLTNHGTTATTTSTVSLHRYTGPPSPHKPHTSASWICDGLMMLWMAGAGEAGLEREMGAVISCPAGGGVAALSPCGSPKRHLSTGADPGIGLPRGAKGWRDRSVQSAPQISCWPILHMKLGPKAQVAGLTEPWFNLITCLVNVN